MRSIKPGRGPSAMSAVSSLVAVVFGVGWTVLAYSFTRDSGVPVIGVVFPLFGVFFVVVGLVQAYYHFTNAAGENRFSAFDITEEGEEPDPLNQAFGRARNQRTPEGGGGRKIKGDFCPYCGAEAHPDFDYCPKCGKDI